MDAATLIGEIEAGREYFVEVGLARVSVTVAQRNRRSLVCTDPEESAENHLLSLPSC